MKQDGRDAVRDYASDLVGRYKPLYLGMDAARIGVVQFGNVALMSQPDGPTGVESTIDALAWQMKNPPVRDVNACE